MSAIVWWLEHSLVPPFLGIGLRIDLFWSCGHCWVFLICWHNECNILMASSFRDLNSSVGIPSHSLAVLTAFLRPTWLCTPECLSLGGYILWIYKFIQLCEFKKWFSSVQFSHSVVSNSLQPHELQHTRPPCPSPSPRVHSNSHPSSQWCHPAISSSVVPFFSCPQSLPASESFPMSQLFTWSGQSTGVSALASFLPKNTQGWSPLEWTG